ncbi:MAG: hypothetical protein NT042_13665, partial [Sulfuritalea sp.]|nr:hypothetical protein [Sulfuritalea sp.]
WEKAEGWNVKQQDGSLKSALLAYGFDVDPQAAIERMTNGEIETLVLHEEGELAAGRLLGNGWSAKLDGFSGKRAELLARAVRDNLADCLVTVPSLLQRGADDSLHFWFSTFDGLRRELRSAYLGFRFAGRQRRFWRPPRPAAPISRRSVCACLKWTRAPSRRSPTRLARSRFRRLCGQPVTP